MKLFVVIEVDPYNECFCGESYTTKNIIGIADTLEKAKEIQSHTSLETLIQEVELNKRLWL